MARPVTQYLDRYAQPEVAAASAAEGSWSAALVVPAFRETTALWEGIERVCQDASALTILVVNQTTSTRVPENEELLAAARSRGPVRQIANRVEQVGASLLLIDRSSPGNEFDDKDGVGLARRIGLDLALALGEQGLLESEWLFTTDADATLPAAYFDVANHVPKDAVGLTYPYRHRLDVSSPALRQAIALYELSLRYYVLGLRWAHSPYAFSAIGSTIAVRRSSYAKVRGMPRRKAGEDFYLLEKLAKLGKVFRPNCAPIELRGDRKPRAPFGTAPSIERMTSSSEPFELYHPDCFAQLRRWLLCLERVALSAQIQDAQECLDDPILGPCLEDLRVLPGLERSLSQSGSHEQIRARLHGFFDAKLTLRLIHRLRDRQLPNQPWARALEAASFIRKEGENTEDPFRWRDFLEDAENTGEQFAH